MPAPTVTLLGRGHNHVSVFPSRFTKGSLWNVLYAFWGELHSKRLCTSRFYVLFGGWKEWLGGERSLNKWSSEARLQGAG